MSALPAAAAYRLWAPNYEPETAVSYLENLVVERLGHRTEGRRLLDVGCGTGRRLRACAAALRVGVDLTLEMIVASSSGASLRSADGPGPATLTAGSPSGLLLLSADARKLPFPDGAFDLVWCRLMIGHVPDPTDLYAEIARVCRAGGSLVVTDLHPAAAAAGHRRTFRDAAGGLREVEHYVHTLERHVALAGAVGLELRRSMDGTVGPEIRTFYAAADRLDAYRQQIGSPLVLALDLRKR